MPCYLTVTKRPVKTHTLSRFDIVNFGLLIIVFADFISFLLSLFSVPQERDFKKVLGWLVISNTNIELILLFQFYITSFSGVTQVQSRAYTAEYK